jgi:hypothetical protein
MGHEEEGQECVEVPMVEETQYIYFFSNSLGPQNCCGLAPALLMVCSDSGYGCPFGYKGKKGCGSVECETRPSWM